MKRAPWLRRRLISVHGAIVADRASGSVGWEAVRVAATGHGALADHAVLRDGQIEGHAAQLPRGHNHCRVDGESIGWSDSSLTGMHRAAAVVPRYCRLPVPAGAAMVASSTNQPSFARPVPQ